jgi:hypothetical protein
MSAAKHTRMAGRQARQTVRAGRLRLVRFAGQRVFTYSAPAGKNQWVRRAGVTTATKER